MQEEQKKQHRGWFRRRGRDAATTAPQANTQPGASGKFGQAVAGWARALQERRDTINRTRELAQKLSSELAAILQTCAEQEKALGQRSVRTQVQLSMALGHLSSIVRQLDTTRSVCAYLIEATQPHLPVITVAQADGQVNGQVNGQVTATLTPPATPAPPSRPLFVAGNLGGPLAAPVVRDDLGRRGFKRMAGDLQKAFRETAQATQTILRPIQAPVIHVPDVNALANSLARLEPLMTWLNQRCGMLTATYCAPQAEQPESV
jgi:hypothetical protein